MEKNQDEKVNF